MSRSIQFSFIALAFLLGLLIPSPFFVSNDASTKENPGENFSKEGASGPAPSRSTSPRKSTRTANEDSSDSNRRLDLQVEVIEALIKGKGMERMLKQMQVAEQDIQTILKIEKDAAQSLKALEARHAKLRSDEDGDYFEIPAFPEDHAAWVDGIERELSSIFGDDRAAVISRIIAQKDNDEQTGLYFRKVRSITRGESILIEETVFEEGSGMIDKDYSIYQGSNENRWEHLFTPKNGPPPE